MALYPTVIIGLGGICTLGLIPFLMHLLIHSEGRRTFVEMQL
jgi:hypothetical protein